MLLRFGARRKGSPPRFWGAWQNSHRVEHCLTTCYLESNDAIHHSIPGPRRARARLSLLLAPRRLRRRGRAKETAAAKPPRDPNAPLAVVNTGLSTPESVLWDDTRRVWYVSNING